MQNFTKLLSNATIFKKIDNIILFWKNIPVFPKSALHKKGLNFFIQMTLIIIIFFKEAIKTSLRLYPDYQRVMKIV